MTLRLADARYRYAGSQRFVLDGVDLSVGAGEVVGVVGPNEAGKSTLCLVAAGLAPAAIGGVVEGSVTVDGVETRTLRPDELATRCGILFQNPHTQLSGTAVTVFEEVAFGPRNLGLPIPELLDRVEWAMETLGISALAPKDPSRISGGQAQLVALASVLALRPPHLVLDEPTSQLDPQGTRLVGDALARLAATRGTAILIVEHKTALVGSLAGRVALLDGGRVVREGPTVEILGDPALVDHGVEPPPGVRLGRSLEAAGLALDHALLERAIAPLQVAEAGGPGAPSQRAAAIGGPPSR